jgi:hypothetical protein
MRLRRKQLFLSGSIAKLQQSSLPSLEIAEDTGKVISCRHGFIRTARSMGGHTAVFRHVQAGESNPQYVCLQISEPFNIRLMSGEMQNNLAR